MSELGELASKLAILIVFAGACCAAAIFTGFSGFWIIAGILIGVILKGE
jgi:hypothetical protein